MYISITIDYTTEEILLLICTIYNYDYLVYTLCIISSIT